MYKAYNDGQSIVWVPNDYVPVDDEIIFNDWPTEEELLAAFPNRAAVLAQLDYDRKSVIARDERDLQLREKYDAGTQMVRRELESGPDDELKAKLLNKLAELHTYARLLQGVPDQSGFPYTITWPAIPTEELS